MRLKVDSEVKFVAIFNSLGSNQFVLFWMYVII